MKGKSAVVAVKNKLTIYCILAKKPEKHFKLSQFLYAVRICCLKCGSIIILFAFRQKAE